MLGDAQAVEKAQGLRCARPAVASDGRGGLRAHGGADRRAQPSDGRGDGARASRQAQEVAARECRRAPSVGSVQRRGLGARRGGGAAGGGGGGGGRPRAVPALLAQVQRDRRRAPYPQVLVDPRKAEHAQALRGSRRSDDEGARCDERRCDERCCDERDGRHDVGRRPRVARADARFERDRRRPTPTCQAPRAQRRAQSRAQSRAGQARQQDGRAAPQQRRRGASEPRRRSTV